MCIMDHVMCVYYGPVFYLLTSVTTVRITRFKPKNNVIGTRAFSASWLLSNTLLLFLFVVLVVLVWGLVLIFEL